MAAAAAEAARVVAGAAGTALDQKTPCTDWDLRTLLGWDIAKATGQDYRCDDAVARNVLQTVEAQGEMFRQYQGFAAIVPVPDDATALDRTLALSGRDPR